MEGCRALLLAILAPGSVEAEVGRLQGRIFSECGFASAAALRPLIPVAFLPREEAARELLDSLHGSARAPYRIGTRQLAWAGGYLFLAVDTGGLWQALRAGAPGCGSALFPAFEGFFLGCGEAAPGQRQTVPAAPPALSFSSSMLALLRIESPVGPGAWWREVYCETLHERPLRGRRAG